MITLTWKSFDCASFLKCSGGVSKRTVTGYGLCSFEAAQKPTVGCFLPIYPTVDISRTYQVFFCLLQALFWSFFCFSACFARTNERRTGKKRKSFLERTNIRFYLMKVLTNSHPTYNQTIFTLYCCCTYFLSNRSVSRIKMVCKNVATETFAAVRQHNRLEI